MLYGHQGLDRGLHGFDDVEGPAGHLLSHGLSRKDLCDESSKSKY